MKERRRPLELAASAAVSLYFLGSPLRLLGEVSLRPRLLIIYVLVAPIVGLLLLLRHRRARFASYIFLTMDVVRTAVRGVWPFLVADLLILLFLQTPLMRRVYPRIDSARVAARWRRPRQD
jgi:hypothetical protein